jgi:putative ABC transport system ATP-binding protein
MNIKRGEFIVIFGTSGGGKTTMLNILGTIDKPTKGELFIGGNRITESTKDHELSDIRLRKIGFVFQTFNLLSSLTALENVEMPLILDGKLSVSERRQRAEEVLGLVGMSPRLDHVPSQLSGGEQQRVTIARALSNRPEVMLLDEPTGDLDTVNTLIVMKLLADLNRKEGITMIMVTHDVSLKYFANRVVWMRDGKIQRIESVSEEKRQETYSKLDADLADVKKAKKRRAKQGHGTILELRKPTDYATHPQHVSRHIPLYDAGEVAKKKKRHHRRRQRDSSDSDSDSG